MTTTSITSGNVVDGFPVHSGDVLEILEGGLAIATSVFADGAELVDAGGAADGTIVL
jgi:autotransporter passenger strand-loop-strand repeat protein